MKDVQHLCGWVNDMAAVKRVMSTLPRPRFADAGAHLIGRAYDTNALLWEATKKVTGDHLPAHKQSIGDCVSEGYSSGVEYLTCVAICQGQPLEYKPISHSAIYGMARELGGMLGGEDGLVGAYAAKCVNMLGVVSCEDAKDSNTDDTLASQWGRRGAPSTIKDLAKKHLVKTVSVVATAEECRAALSNGYPVAVCSNQGFSMERDSDGYCRAQGSWSHCMCIIGYRADSRRFCILQSWGQNTPSGPTTLGQPDCSFWADWNVVDRMLGGEKDSWALSNFEGFPAQNLSWLI